MFIHLKQLYNKARVYLVIILFLATRLIGLGPDISNSDAGRWHRRSENFLMAIKQGNFSETYQRYHPGVTLMWINSIVKQVAFTYQLKTAGEPKTLENADYYPIIHGISKGALVLILGALLLLQMKYISKLFDKSTALIYSFLVALEPYLVGINRWFHLTSLEVFLVFTSLLALLVWKKEGDKKTLIFSSILFGLAVLTKTSALILFPVFLFILLEGRLGEGRRSLTKTVGRFCLVSFITFLILFPAMWVESITVIQNIINSLFGAVSEDIRTNLIPSYLVPSYYLIIMLLRLSPITLLLFILGLWKIRDTKDFNVKIILHSIFVYYIFLTLANQKIDRYIISFIPFILLICAFYISGLRKKLKVIFLILPLLFFILISWKYYPIYSAYYSPIFGGTKTVVKLGLYDNSGEYFSQVANYLNEKGRDIHVYVPNNVESFSYYYKGNLQHEYNEETDYIIRSLYMNRNEFIENNCPTIEESYGVGADIVRIYVCK